MRILLLLSGTAYLLRDQAFMGKVSWAIAGIVAYALISAAGVMLSFSAAIACLPLQDVLMRKLDGLLGYDWRAYGEFAKSSALLTSLLRFSYFSIDWQPIVVVAVLAFRSDQRRMISYIVSTIVALVFTAAIFSIAPVTTAWTYGTINDVHDAARLAMNDSWVSELERLRSGELRTISWGIIGAVVGFPSFHCIAALLNTWSLWHVRTLRLFWLPLNVALIASSLVHGGHYLVDLIAGVLIAITSIYTARAIIHLIIREIPMPSVMMPQPA